jgi:hypothetical protein
MTTRIYIVQNGADVPVRLVDAASQSQAIRHVTANLFSARVATTHEVARLVADGVEVEDAGRTGAPAEAVQG